MSFESKQISNFPSPSHPFFSYSSWSSNLLLLFPENYNMQIGRRQPGRRVHTIARGENIIPRRHAPAN